MQLKPKSETGRVLLYSRASQNIKPVLLLLTLVLGLLLTNTAYQPYQVSKQVQLTYFAFCRFLSSLDKTVGANFNNFFHRAEELAISGKLTESSIRDE